MVVAWQTTAVYDGNMKENKKKKQEYNRTSIEEIMEHMGKG